MRCPFCHNDTTIVLETRLNQDGTIVRRRRACPACGKRFTTYEKTALKPGVAGL